MPRKVKLRKHVPQPSAPPPPKTILDAKGRPYIPGPTWPSFLQRYTKRVGTDSYTVRDIAQVRFLNPVSDEDRYAGLVNFICHTWPQHFVQGLAHVPDGVIYPAILPTTNWNPWTDRLLRGFTSTKHAIRQGNSIFRFIALTGSGACGKTHSAGLYAAAWWAADPENSIAVLTSTTKDMIRSRVWSVIRHYATTARSSITGEPLELGRLVDSQMKLIAPSGSAKNSIAAYAVAHGETLKAIDNLKGLHAKRMLVVIDEANGTPEAIFNVLPNYRKGCQDLTVIVIGNPVSRMDPHGRACKPAEGWSLAADDKQIEWRTEGVPEWQCDSGLCLRFDGRDSPNVRLKKNAFPYLYSYDDWRRAQDGSHVGTFAYWSFDRGMWPPEGASNTIFTEQLFLRCSATGQHFEWETQRETYAFCDVGFGGDACCVQIAEVGKVAGRDCIMLTDSFEVPIDPTAVSHDLDYQIARRLIVEMTTRKVKPACFGLDATGPGRGVAAIMAAEWSPAIHCINWAGAVSERSSSQNDGRPAREVYDRMVTECWFGVRELLEADQIKGFSPEAMNQFCARLYEMKGKKYSLEKKEDMKLRVRYSPDEADAVVGLVEIARRNGVEIEGKIAQNVQRDWQQQAKSLQDELFEQAPVHDSGGWAEQDVSGGVVVEGYY